MKEMNYTHIELPPPPNIIRISHGDNMTGFCSDFKIWNSEDFMYFVDEMSQGRYRNLSRPSTRSLQKTLLGYMNLMAHLLWIRWPCIQEQGWGTRALITARQKWFPLLRIQVVFCLKISHRRTSRDAVSPPPITIAGVKKNRSLAHIYEDLKTRRPPPQLRTIMYLMNIQVSAMIAEESTAF